MFKWSNLQSAVFVECCTTPTSSSKFQVPNLFQCESLVDVRLATLLNIVSKLGVLKIIGFQSKVPHTFWVLPNCDIVAPVMYKSLRIMGYTSANNLLVGLCPAS